MLRKLFWVILGLLTIYYVVQLTFTPLELLQYVIGVFLLWTPITIITFILLKTLIQDIAINLIFSLAASYTLTTLFYFLQGVFLSDSLVLFLGIVYVSLVITLAFEFRKSLPDFRNVKLTFKPDKTLLFLIVLTLVVNLPYKVAWRTNAHNERTYTLFHESFYYVSLVHELDRGIPPTQAPNRAGTPDRAYHNLPHLTTLLISKISSQSDFLRGIYVDHYTVLDILTCLVLFAIGKTLTKKPIGGYILVAAMYTFSIPNLGLFHPEQLLYPFTVWTHQSNLSQILYQAPQYYGSMPVFLGLILIILLIARQFYETTISTKLLIFAALLLIALLRFRASIFLCMAPAFSLMLAIMWFRQRKFSYLIVFCVLVAGSAVLYFETTSSVYFRGSNSIMIAFNHFTEWDNPGAYANTWPGAHRVYDFLKLNIGTYVATLNWSWQAISLTAFTLLNVIGIPLLILGIYFLVRMKNHKEWQMWAIFLIVSPIICILGAILLTTNYDSYSLASQLGYVPYWFFFILLPIGVLDIYCRLQYRWRYIVSRSVFALYAMLVIAQLIAPFVFNMLVKMPAVVDNDQWLAFQQIRDNTPYDTTLLINLKQDKPEFIHSGLTGRRIYLEGDPVTNPLETLLASKSPDENRVQKIDTLWSVTNAETFCKNLLQTNANYLIEYDQSPLQLTTKPTCMTPSWTSPEKRVVIWEIHR